MNWSNTLQCSALIMLFVYRSSFLYASRRRIAVINMLMNDNTFHMRGNRIDTLIPAMTHWKRTQATKATTEVLACKRQPGDDQATVAMSMQPRCERSILCVSNCWHTNGAHFCIAKQTMSARSTWNCNQFASAKPLNLRADSDCY